MECGGLTPLCISVVPAPTCRAVAPAQADQPRRGRVPHPLSPSPANRASFSPLLLCGPSPLSPSQDGPLSSHHSSLTATFFPLTFRYLVVHCRRYIGPLLRPPRHPAPLEEAPQGSSQGVRKCTRQAVRLAAALFSPPLLSARIPPQTLTNTKQMAWKLNFAYPLCSQSITHSRGRGVPPFLTLFLSMSCRAASCAPLSLMPPTRHSPLVTRHFPAVPCYRVRRINSDAHHSPIRPQR